VDAANLDKATFNLSIKNPNNIEEISHHSPKVIIDEIAALDHEGVEIIEPLRMGAAMISSARLWKDKQIGEILRL
jgi:hypothetical protein